ncbi:hypothetical protein EVG20_g5676 [Dentipellis fragilis]|uniref:Uncharacterized protein n=1 Tax=Dentipellis fragilis TaxID=205917 RepID=A0A4Y9YRK8_9AGAM|nr:hypothetical protein EVG20_g5676 [Dentipellis fragilis]
MPRALLQFGRPAKETEAPGRRTHPTPESGLGSAGTHNQPTVSAIATITVGRAVVRLELECARGGRRRWVTRGWGNPRKTVTRGSPAAAGHPARHHEVVRCCPDPTQARRATEVRSSRSRCCGMYSRRASVERDRTYLFPGLCAFSPRTSSHPDITPRFVCLPLASGGLVVAKRRSSWLAVSGTLQLHDVLDSKRARDLRSRLVLGRKKGVKDARIDNNIDIEAYTVYPRSMAGSAARSAGPARPSLAQHPVHFEFASVPRRLGPLPL